MKENNRQLLLRVKISTPQNITYSHRHMLIQPTLPVSSYLEEWPSVHNPTGYATVQVLQTSLYTVMVAVSLLV